MNRCKYPRTFHLPWSKGFTNDDKVLSSVNHFQGKEVVVTEKMDGENTTGYADGFIHARSIDSVNHPSRNWVKSFLASRLYQLNDEWRVCGENLYAQHSISYHMLESYFLAFSVWNDKNICLSWDDTLEILQQLDIHPVRILYRGLWDQSLIESLYRPGMYSIVEGYVVRLADSFSFNSFGISVAKFVREKHVQTDEHWMHSEMVVNRLAKESEQKQEIINDYN